MQLNSKGLKISMMKQKLNLIARPVVKNKFWVVENNDTKVATIQAVEDGGFVYVENQQRRRYPTIKILSNTHNVTFDNIDKNKIEPEVDQLHGYPTSHKPYNILWDVKHKFPVFTKSKKSKSFFCAGYYAVKFNDIWVKSFCPKLITVNRYKFRGPFKLEADLDNEMAMLNGK